MSENATPYGRSRRTRVPAEERRAEIVAAALTEFAATGYAGTSTEAIARRAGVSQPYLFQLFGTKRDLFIAGVRHGFARTRLAFETTGRAARAENPHPHHILHAMGARYHELLQDRELLLCQLQAYAACEDPEIRAAVRDEWIQMYRLVAEVSGAEPHKLAEWFAYGMLMNTGAAIGADLVDVADPAESLGRLAAADR
jgi:AcrR family transcriptional regulator